MSGYGLEVMFGGLANKVKNVSILLCLDTGWKQFLQVAIHDGRYLFQSSYVWIRAGRNIRTIRSLA